MQRPTPDATPARRTARNGTMASPTKKPVLLDVNVKRAMPASPPKIAMKLAGRAPSPQKTAQQLFEKLEAAEARRDVEPRRGAAVRFTNTINAVSAELVERPAPLEPDAAAVVEHARRERLGRHVDLARVQAEVVLAGVLVPPYLCENQISGGPTRRHPRDCVYSMALISTRRQTRPCKTRWWTAIAKCLARWMSGPS